MDRRNGKPLVGKSGWGENGGQYLRLETSQGPERVLDDFVGKKVSSKTIFGTYTGRECTDSDRYLHETIFDYLAFRFQPLGTGLSVNAGRVGGQFERV